MYIVTKEERIWAMLSHLLGLVGYFFIPLGNIVAPLIIYLIKKDELPFVADQAREALNFQISREIFALISGVLGVTIYFSSMGFLFSRDNPGHILGISLIVFLVFPLLFAANWLSGVILTVMAAIKASNGKSYRYPLTIRLVR